MTEDILFHLGIVVVVNFVLALLLHRIGVYQDQVPVEPTPRLGEIGLEGVVVDAETPLFAPATDQPCAVWWISQPYLPVGRHQGASDWVPSILLRLPSGAVVRVRFPPSLGTFIGNPVFSRISSRDRSADPKPKIGGIPASGLKIWEEKVCVGDHVFIAGEFSGPDEHHGVDPMRTAGLSTTIETWTMLRRGVIHVGTANDLKFFRRVSRWSLRHLYGIFFIFNGLYISLAGYRIGLWR